MCHGWWMRTENCENLCMKQFASSILAFSRITIQTQYSKYKRKKKEKKNENKTRNTQSKRTNNEIIDLITKHQWEKKMKNGKKCGRAEKWHERRKKKYEANGKRIRMYRRPLRVMKAGRAIWVHLECPCWSCSSIL